LFYDKTDIDITKQCIGKTRSMNYGEMIYIPYIDYGYVYHQKEYETSSVYWDFESSYKTRWIQSDTDDNTDIALAREKVKTLTKSQKAYVLKILPSIAYLDIGLSQHRKRYFLLLGIVSSLMFLFLICKVCYV
jgi:hypothetical protein